MNAWLAHSLAEQGHYAAADQCLADVSRHPHVSAITQVCALTVAGVLAARRGRDGMVPLDEALRIAIQTGEYQRLRPVAVARAEAAWIAGRPADVATDIDRASSFAIALRRPWELGELSWWLHLAGEHRQASAPLASPFALMLSGEHRAAAGEWRDMGCPLWSAYALAFSPRLQDAQECLEILDSLGVPAVRHAVLRDRHAHGLMVPRGPRPATRASPAGLTGRETEVLQLLAEGLSYAEIAERLVLSERTVGHHVSAVLRKLGEPTRSRAVARALRMGVLPPR
jgi:DNA-binding CsgD family transcriptional regulator/predicted nucleic acid-binding protein